MIAVICLAGGIGAAVRYLVGVAWSPRGLPAAIFTINVVGSFGLGVVLGLAGDEIRQWHIITGVGFLGGFTTFSTASVDTARLIQERRYGAALVNGPGMLLTAVFAGAAGYWLAT